MDTYLPAEFRRLHDSAAADWRDAPGASSIPSAAKPAVGCDVPREDQRVVDPSWLGI